MILGRMYVGNKSYVNRTYEIVSCKYVHYNKLYVRDNMSYVRDNKSYIQIISRTYEIIRITISYVRQHSSGSDVNSLPRMR